MSRWRNLRILYENLCNLGGYSPLRKASHLISTVGNLLVARRRSTSVGVVRLSYLRVNCGQNAGDFLLRKYIPSYPVLSSST
jgi:hypothetical protein